MPPIRSFFSVSPDSRRRFSAWSVIAGLALAVCVGGRPMSAQTTDSSVIPKAPESGITFDALHLQHKRATEVVEAGKIRSHTKQFDLTGIPDYQPGEKLHGKLRVWGLNYMGDCGLAATWAEGFKKYQPDVTIEYNLPTALVAVPGLITGSADLGATRPLTFDDRLTFQRAFDTTPTEIKMVNSSFDVGGYAPAQGIVVNRDNPLTGLTLKQLDGIFGTERSGGYVGITWHPEFARGADQNIRTWGQLGLGGKWKDQTINPHMVTLRYHDPNVFEDVVLHGSDKWTEHLHEYNTYLTPQGNWYGHGEQILDAVEKDPYAIGVIIMSEKNKVDPKKFRLLPIARTEGGPYVAPTLENVQNLSYPIINYEWWVFYRRPGSPVEPRLREFLRYVLSREGQEAVQRNGKFTPLTADVAKEELAKLD